MTDKIASLKERKKLYHDTLTGNILPFWIEHGLDRKYGGIYTCLDREGKLMDSTKSVWFQGRTVYTLSYTYNHVDPNPLYLEVAQNILGFMERHCFAENGRMYFEMKEDGTPLRMRRYVFSETFAIIAMAEYAKATGEKKYAEKAFELFEKTISFLRTPGFLEPKYLPSLEAIGHSISMILLNTAVTLREVHPHPSIDRQIEESFRLIKDKLYLPEYHALMEMVTPDGELIDTISGRTINPGHCIETAWFLFEAAGTCSDLPFAREMQEFGLTVLDDAWARGWDEPYGGIINFKDVKGFPAQDYSQDMKFWWPQCEAIIANLYAYRLTGADKYLERYNLCHDWAWTHLVDKEYPEWYGYLHRDGTVAQPAKGNLFKGPFHIPRMLAKCTLIIDEILGKE